MLIHFQGEVAPGHLSMWGPVRMGHFSLRFFQTAPTVLFALKFGPRDRASGTETHWFPKAPAAHCACKSDPRVRLHRWTPDTQLPQDSSGQRPLPCRLLGKEKVVFLNGKRCSRGCSQEAECYLVVIYAISMDLSPSSQHILKMGHMLRSCDVADRQCSRPSAALEPKGQGI